MKTTFNYLIRGFAVIGFLVITLFGYAYAVTDFSKIKTATVPDFLYNSHKDRIVVLTKEGVSGKCYKRIKIYTLPISEKDEGGWSKIETSCKTFDKEISFI